MEYNKLIPELSVSNIDKSIKFYVDIIGFAIEYERNEDKFVFISYQGSQIMLEEINNHWNVGELHYPFGRGINFQIETNELDHIYESLLKHNISIYKPIFESKYKVDDITYIERELLVQDPDGYLLRFQETIGEE